MDRSSLPTAARVDEIFGIVCPSTTVCWVDGLYNSDSSLAVERSTDGGVTWAPVSIPATIEQQTISNPYAFGVSCPDATHCRFMSYNFVLTTDDSGATWSLTPPASGFGFGNSLSCPDDTHCYTADGGAPSISGDAVLASSDGGHTWAAAAGFLHPVGTGLAMDGVACVSVLQCTAVGETWGNSPTGSFRNSFTASTVNGWSTYQSTNGPSTIQRFRSVSCVDANHCWASGLDASSNLSIAVTSNGGGAWT